MDTEEALETIKEFSRYYKKHIFDDDQTICQGYGVIISKLKKIKDTNGQAK